MNRWLALAFFALSSFALAKPPAKLELFDRHVYVIEPNIEMLLELTSEQQEKIEADLTAYKESDEIRVAKEAADGDASAKKIYYQTVEAAQKDYLTRAQAILNEKQKALIEKANAFANQIGSDCKGEVDEIMAQIKAGEKTWADRLALVRKRGQERIAEILTPEQIEVIRANRPEGVAAPSEQ